ncbi:MFS transporter [Pseudomonas fluorescens]|uniref:MFS transporter n=1 Tax=Pseudomonas fluorescens TaxID=294 RepID=UPI0005FB4536|nr:MFS transporter [Pseudomonas fluorescens]KJZ35763.1 multidrug DMT transporter permease [Pseudomonas fluorescens]
MTVHHAHTDKIETSTVSAPRLYAWVVFALSFGLLISDYMSRQVLNAIFPLLKSEWALSDAQLGLLSGIVALMVGLLAVPLSMMADRWGRVRSLVLMASLWSLATLSCGLAQNYEHMFLARLLVGIGEAAYGSVGVAVVLSVFPKHMRATLISAFMAGGMFGSVLGMALGGLIAEHLGWRSAFVVMATFGLALAVIYPLVVKEARLGNCNQAAGQSAESGGKSPLRTLYSSRSVISAYVGSGLQMFIGGSLIVWLPSYLNRYYHMGTDQAGMISALLILTGGAGMILCGILSDRLCRKAPERKISLAIAYCLITSILLSVAMLLPPGVVQLVVIALAMLVVTGTSGPAGAMVANLTHPSVHGTAFATLSLANNLLGQAPGPYITGLLADNFGLDRAFQLIPLISIAAALVFCYGKRHYQRDIQKRVPTVTGATPAGKMS